MAYNKKNWQDNVSDITAAELNRMEQGIYDNSLVVEAITNKLNPTDTETYKTAELTEGQITDVIGVNDIIIKGQTSQDGEPTPSSPVDVNVVSGSNVINISNKNLLNLDFVEDSDSFVGLSFSHSKSEFSLKGTATGTYKTFMLKNKINFVESNQYTLSAEIAGTNPKMQVRIMAYDSSNQLIWSIAINKNNNYKNTSTFNPSAEIDHYTFIIESLENGGVYNLTAKIQLEQESTATTYEPHQGKELPLDLGTIELCKIGNYQDYFYKSGSKWYLHKEIGKIVLDGSENWGKASDINNHNRYSVALSTGANNATFLCYSNYFKGVTRSGLVNANEIAVTNYINILIDNITTDTDFKTWLASNNITLYYILATLTDTEITGTLKEQLEAIYNAPLYEQTNITQTNNDLPMVLDITACKDNINGIKAFIRK